MYWSERFSLVEGGVLKITVYSYSPISWFGVDWSSLDVRGVFAPTDINEDGWSFDPVYPEHSSVDASSDGINLMLVYNIQESGDYQLVVKNANTLNSWRLSIAVTSIPGSASEHRPQDILEP